MRDKHAVNMSTSTALQPGNSAVNTTQNESPLIKPCTTQVEDFAQHQMMVPIFPPGTGFDVFSHGESMLLLNDKNETQSDEEADVFLSSSS